MQGTWPQALKSFFTPIVLVMLVRWLLIEPFVIPSGSMIPNLLIHDHILVDKLSMGIHFPFLDKWLMRWSEPQRGDIVVFKNPQNPDIYFIKRLIGLPGDHIRFEKFQLSINGGTWPLEPAPPDDLKGFSEESIGALADFNYFYENIPGHKHLVRYLPDSMSSSELQEYHVPKGKYFFMGDNRDQSSDSRYWGFVPEDLLVGKASLIWLSCEQTLASMPHICDISKMRWSRLFGGVQSRSD